jgi:hypothetical protein
MYRLTFNIILLSVVRLVWPKVVILPPILAIVVRHKEITLYLDVKWSESRMEATECSGSSHG